MTNKVKIQDTCCYGASYES